MTIPASLLPHVRRIHDALAMGSLSQEDLDRPLLGEVQATLRAYPGRPSIAPTEAYDTAYVFPINNSEPPQISIEVDVWMDGKRSEVTSEHIIRGCSILDSRRQYCWTGCESREASVLRRISSLRMHLFSPSRQPGKPLIIHRCEAERQPLEILRCSPLPCSA